MHCSTTIRTVPQLDLVKTLTLNQSFTESCFILHGADHPHMCANIFTPHDQPCHAIHKVNSLVTNNMCTLYRGFYNALTIKTI